MHVKLRPDCCGKWWERVLAAFIFFTRLPLWRAHQPPRECYSTVVEHWPLTGWLTGGIMAVIIYFGNMVMPPQIVCVVAIAARMLLTGALHEDGLADFFDGFGGGGNDRQRILAIMKDSRIGTYGVLALAIYLLLIWLCINALPTHVAVFAVFAADPYCKMVSGQIIQVMPYARTEQTSKSGVVYRRMGITAGIIFFIEGALPLALLIYKYGHAIGWSGIVFVPCIVFYFLYLFIWRRLRGYTGDCCGAVFLLTELSFYITVIVCLYK